MRNLSLPVPIRRSHVHLTSAAVNGLPSCHLTPWRSGKVSSLPSSLHSHLVRHCVIGKEAHHHLPQPLSLARDRFVHSAPKLLLDLPHLGPFTVASGPPKEQKPAAPRPTADVGEAQEVKCLRLAKSRLLPFLRRPATELDQTRLFLVPVHHRLQLIT